MAYVLPMLFVLGVYVALPAVLVVGWVRWAGRRQSGRTWREMSSMCQTNLFTTVGQAPAR